MASLRGIPGGYDLDTPPIHVAPIPAESPVSWLRRTAVRYQISPRDVLREGGAVRQITSTRAAITRTLSPHNGFTTRLGLSDDDQATLRAPTPLGTALRAYARLYQRPDDWEAATTSRYCPACLAGTEPYWAKDWANPLLALCPDHDVLLLDRCPVCDAAPYASPTWLAAPIEPWRCAARTTPAHSPRRQVRPWCSQDLRTAPTQHATPAQSRAQRLLLDLARRPDETFEVCGITATRRIAFDAMVELTTGPLHSRGAGFLDLAEPPDEIATALADTLDVLDATSPDRAGHHLQGLLLPTSRKAPGTIAAALTPPPKNPLLGALQLDHHRHAMTATSQLTFRTSAHHAQYPLQAGQSPATRRHLQLPEHRPDLPIPSAAWIPQVLWPGTVPDLGEDPIARAEVALLLAHLGTTRPWSILTVELGLPHAFHAKIVARTRARRSDGTWPQLLTKLDHVLEHLRANPPWIDYRNRRVLADDLDLLDQALTTAHPGPTRIDARRRFWELFTGGDATYAPEPLNISADQYPHWAQQRGDTDAAYTEQFDAAFQILDRSSPLRLGKPLTWRPP
ncbi:TniQ family protein [Cellulomonas sp. ATA003]|uniref:TniQ family protein n=1 Tax=Cellulomonas sp. ATA003 TaxID=3073064 RepID=UPI002872DF28|nr:TniQ family protein [Cellulomonas sp. ATA003]WNB85785.1 TniQ family protein [Cellulomonas sp. ATA003]